MYHTKLTYLGSTGRSVVRTLEGLKNPFLQRMFLEMERVEHDHMLPGDRFVSEMILINTYSPPVTTRDSIIINGIAYSNSNHAYRYYPDFDKVLVVVKDGNALPACAWSDTLKANLASAMA